MKLQDLTDVNIYINAHTSYTSDPEKFGTPEFWAIADGEGDCEDYALAKYRKLIALGWPKEWLRLAACYVETGEYHAVLLADIDGQTFVLDNRYPYPMDWNLLKYRWDKLQIAGTKQWELV